MFIQFNFSIYLKCLFNSIYRYFINLYYQSTFKINNNNDDDNNDNVFIYNNNNEKVLGV